jgi:hypothetical protein
MSRYFVGQSYGYAVAHTEEQAAAILADGEMVEVDQDTYAMVRLERLAELEEQAAMQRGIER